MDKGIDQDVCDTGLGLGLSYKESVSSISIDQQWRRGTPVEPSLTLGLSGDPFGLENKAKQPPFSQWKYCFSVKRKKDMGEDEAETEKVSTGRASDEEEDGGARKKLRLTKEQSSFLEKSFKEHTTLTPKQKQVLAKHLDLRPRQVEVWFQNRRARTKLKQTEVDCVFLKKCFETLTDENRRLHKELQELKRLKSFQPSTHLKIATTTLRMCPKCKKTTGREEDGGNISPSPKPLFFNYFTHSATTC